MPLMFQNDHLSTLAGTFPPPPLGPDRDQSHKLDQFSALSGCHPGDRELSINVRISFQTPESTSECLANLCTNMDAAAAAAGSAVWTVCAINSYQGDSHDDPDVSLPGLLTNDKSVRRAYLPLLLHAEKQWYIVKLLSAKPIWQRNLATFATRKKIVSGMPFHWKALCRRMIFGCSNKSDD